MNEQRARVQYVIHPTSVPPTTERIVDFARESAMRRAAPFWYGILAGVLFGAGVWSLTTAVAAVPFFAGTFGLLALIVALTFAPPARVVERTNDVEVVYTPPDDEPLRGVRVNAGDGTRTIMLDLRVGDLYFDASTVTAMQRRARVDGRLVREPDGRPLWSGSEFVRVTRTLVDAGILDRAEYDATGVRRFTPTGMIWLNGSDNET